MTTELDLIKSLKVFPAVNEGELPIYELSIYPEDILRERASEITEFGDYWQEVGELMLNTMWTYEGIGLAANQVFLNKRIIVVLQDLDYDENDPEADPKTLIMLNPEILESSGPVAVTTEGCLSAPGLRADVERPQQIKVKYFTPQGEEVVIDAQGLFAVVIQHEIDHLDGKMFFDHLSSFKRNQFMDQLRKKKKDNVKKLIPEIA